MKIGELNPGDIVACELDGDRRVLRVGNTMGVKFKKGVRCEGTCTAVLVDRLDPDTLRDVPFKDGYEYPSSIVDADLDVELVATVSFMRSLRRARHMTAGIAAGFMKTDDVEMDPMQKGKL